MIRLFVALDLPAEIRETLAAMAGGVPGARWVAVENLHLTLRFIGEVPEPGVEEIVRALARVRELAFDLELSGVGHFGPARRARALWAGVRRQPALARLQQRVERAVGEAGLPPEPRKFTPHVTLGRLRDAPAGRVHRFMETHGGFGAGPFPVDRFVLHSSRLGHEGPAYSVEADFLLYPPAA